MNGYRIIFAIVCLSGWIFATSNAAAQAQSGASTTAGGTATNMEKTLGTSEDVLPPSPAPIPPESQETKKNLPRIEKQDVVITGEDRSRIKHEEQGVSLDKQPGSVNVPAVGVLKTEAPEMLPVPKVIEKQAVKPSREPFGSPQTPLYSFSVSYGSKESLTYDFSHSREAQTKNGQRFSYCFGVQREKSSGFSQGTISSPFEAYSTDGLNGEGVVYFKDYSVRAGMSYFSHVVTLPYTGTQANKLEKGGFADYDIRIPGGSGLKLGIKSNRCTLSDTSESNNVSCYLRFTTPFTAGAPPIALGVIISDEKITREGTSSHDTGYYSLYAESRNIKVAKVNLDAKVAATGYKNTEYTPRIDYCLAASYPGRKPDMVFQLNLEGKLSLPDASEYYVHENYTGIASELKPQASRKIRVGGNWSISQDVALSGSVFSENISDFLSWRKTADMLYEPANIGNVRLSGLELRLWHNLTKRLVQSISLINTKHKNQSDGMVVPYVPGVRLRIGLGYADSKDLSVSLDGEYIGKRYAAYDNKDKKLQGYFLVTLTADKQVNDTMSCTFTWENLLGAEYEIRDGYWGSPTIANVGLKLKF